MRPLKQHSVSCAFLALILVSSFFVGCFGDDEEGVYTGPINMTIGVAETSGMIEIIKGQNNQTVSEDYVTFEFDFSQVTSEGSNIAEIMLLPDDGSDRIVQDPADNAIISYEYTTHGIYNVELGAKDENGNAYTKNMKLRVDYLIWHNETNANVPNEIWVDTAPGSNTSVGPSRIHVISTVENQNNGIGPLFGGGPSTVTFRMNDETGTEVSTHTEEIAEGDTYEWETEWPNPNPGAWEVEFEVEGDSVNSNSIIMIHYPEEESEPVELESSMEESESEE